MSKDSVVVVGGGFGGVYATKELLKRNIPVTLISETNHFTFTPLLHEVATGALISHDAAFAYESFFASKKFQFIRGHVSDIDRKKKIVHLKEGGEMSYKQLVLATGSTTNFYKMKGVEHAFVLKNIHDAVELKQAILAEVQNIRRDVKINVIGGGPTGLELVFELDRLLRSLKKREKDIQYKLGLIHASDVFCKGEIKPIQAYIEKALKKAGIEVHRKTYAEGITKTTVETTNGTFDSDITIVCAGVQPNTRFCKEALTTDDAGHVPVLPTLQSKEDPHVFALGDIISMEEHLVPKLAQTAVRQAPIVAENVKRLRKSENSAFKTYHPNVAGMLFSLGYGNGVGRIGPIFVKGLFAWYLWRTVYLFKTPGLANKLRVAFSWTLDLFKGRNITEF